MCRLLQVLYDIGVVSTKEPFKCVINQGIILGEVSIALLWEWFHYVSFSIINMEVFISKRSVNMPQVQYIAYKDQNGNLISADLIDELTECNQERIPEEKVCSLPALNLFSFGFC